MRIFILLNIITWKTIRITCYCFYKCFRWTAFNYQTYILSGNQILTNVLKKWRSFLALKPIYLIEAFKWDQAVTADPGVINFIFFVLFSTEFYLENDTYDTKNKGEGLLSNVRYSVCWFLSSRYSLQDTCVLSRTISLLGEWCSVAYFIPWYHSRK